MTAPTARYPLLGHGFFWQDLESGQKFQTFNRTVTETDLVNFISCTGMLEIIFIDAEGAASAIGGRPVPAALTYLAHRRLHPANDDPGHRHGDARMHAESARPGAGE